MLVMVQRCELTCRSDRELYFLGTLYGLHALVLLLGTFLAWETRKVRVCVCLCVSLCVCVCDAVSVCVLM